MLCIETSRLDPRGPEMIRRRSTARKRGSDPVQSAPLLKHPLCRASYTRAKPRVPAKRRRRENVMQSSYGSSPEGQRR